MLNLKKTAVAVLALSSSAVFAGTMGPVCSAVPVTMPCESSGWQIGANALYFSVNPGAATSATYTSSSGGSLSNNVNPSFNWGFNINGSMMYGTGRAIGLSWDHVKSTNTRTLGAQSLVGNGALSAGSSFTPGISFTALSTTGATASISPQYDTVDMPWIQKINFSDVTSLNMHIGWRWAGLVSGSSLSMAGSETHTTDSGTFGPTAYSFTDNVSTSFYGFGPRVGFDGTYGIYSGLNLTGGAAVGLLAGYARTNLTHTVVSTAASISSATTNVNTPLFIDGDLGLNYTLETGYGNVELLASYVWHSFAGPYNGAAAPVTTTENSSRFFTVSGVKFGLSVQGEGF